MNGERPRFAVLTEDGQVMPCDLLEWACNFKGKQRLIAQEYLFDHWISTVFLGLDHGYDPCGPPLWFETMIFKPARDGGELGTPIFRDRYTTLKEALSGHEAAKCWFKRNL